MGAFMVEVNILQNITISSSIGHLKEGMDTFMLEDWARAANASEYVGKFLSQDPTYESGICD